MNGLTRFAEFVVNIISNFLKIKVTPEQHLLCVQFIKFGVVGLSNTLISYVLYSADMMLLFKLDILPQYNYLVAQLTAFILSVLWSFYWNNRAVFSAGYGQNRSLWRALIKTYVSYSFTGLFLSSILLILWINICGISEFIAPLINLVITVPLNFIMNKFWAFR